MEINSLERFLKAQEKTYAVALGEIQKGEKESCWMWYIFPQLRGLGKSHNSYFYGINGLGEARAYLAHPVLSHRLFEITKALLSHKGMEVEDLIGDLDVEKLRSCMTLFAVASDGEPIFQEVLDCFFHGKRDKKTLEEIGL